MLLTESPAHSIAASSLTPRHQVRTTMINWVVKLIEEVQAGRVTRELWEQSVKQLMVEGHLRRAHLLLRRGKTRRAAHDLKTERPNWKDPKTSRSEDFRTLTTPHRSSPHNQFLQF